jgi:hypothetical protein
MRFTYVANVLCESRFIHHQTCAGVVDGEVAQDVKTAQTNALSQATAERWLQIGDQVWCPSCAEKRPQTEHMLDVRKGRFCPTTGLRVRFAHPKAGALGHQLTACQNLTEGDCYTVNTVLPGIGPVSITLLEVPGLWFNCELFDEAIPTKPTKKPRKTKP